MSAGHRTWPEPQAGQILWCRFPEDAALKPALKPRPALVLTVYDDDAPNFRVLVAYGTSQKTDRPYAGEFRIALEDGEAYSVAGLSYPTKFNLAKAVELPFDGRWFGVAPGVPHGQTPKLGLLHPSLYPRVAAAWRAARTRRR